VEDRQSRRGVTDQRGCGPIHGAGKTRRAGGEDHESGTALEDGNIARAAGGHHGLGEYHRLEPEPFRFGNEVLALSVTWIPTSVKGEPGGPIRNGMTYIVRPRIEPAKILERRS
jgi:hypothetical protein